MILSESWRYHPEQILNLLGLLPPDVKPVSPLVRMPVYLLCEGEYVKIEWNNIDLACSLVAIKHNALCRDAPYFEDEQWDAEGESEEEIECLSDEETVVYE